jgi:hypothetical protein
MTLDKGCDIRRAGYNEDNVAQLDLKAQDGTFNWNFFYSSTDNARVILAVALAAITTGKAVECQVDDPATNSHPGISAIWLVS